MKYERLTEKAENGKPYFDGCLRCDLESDCGLCPYWASGLDRLAELEDKIEQGTLIELPCKVGDTVYWVFELVKNKLEILEGKVRGISISQNKSFWFSVIYEYGLTFEHTFKDYWNKTVFLTKAEAENKLKELQE